MLPWTSVCSTIFISKAGCNLKVFIKARYHNHLDYIGVHEAGFEPAKRIATDLKSIPFDQTRVTMFINIELT